MRTKQQISADIKRNRTETQNAIEGVRANRDLTDDGKRRKLFELYKASMQRHQELRAEAAGLTESRKAELEKALFSAKVGFAASSAEKQQARVNFRDALDRAEGAEDLQRLLRGAEQTGDEQQAHAAFVVANDNADVDVMRVYLDSRPQEAALYGQYVALGRDDTADLLREAFESYPLPTPEEIRGYQPPLGEEVAGLFGNRGGGVGRGYGSPNAGSQPPRTPPLGDGIAARRRGA